MQLRHMFTVPVDGASAFAILKDIVRVAHCLPGASVDRVGEDGSFTGEVVVRLGPMQVAYRGEARFVDLDEDRLTATMDAKGREVRGNGTARAAIAVHLDEKGARQTEVLVETDLHITGRPAQFGRGVIADVSERLLSEFAECLRTEISRDSDVDDGEHDR